MKKINWNYAFGEILIVIIGITIAFSLNRCSENSKSKTQKQQYLTNLRNDLEADKLQLEDNIKSIEEKMELCNEIIRLLKKPLPEKLAVANHLFKVASIINFEANNITYITMVNSGDLNLVDNFELKKAIEKHYSEYKKMNKAYLRQENIVKEHLGNYLIYNTNYDAFAKGEFGFKDEKLLNNIVQSLRGSLSIKLSATKSGTESCQSLLEKLNYYK